MALPQHIEQVPGTREAYAPYNFVPLPEKVVPAEPLPTHDTYHADRYTGRIACTLTTESPLYVRCGYTPEDYAAIGDRPFHELSAEEKRRRAQFFHLGDTNQPVIPGSSLRGMLRALVEIASYSKMEKVTDKQLFYRSVRDDDYRKLFVEECERLQHTPHPRASCYHATVRAGFLRRRHGAFVIEECHLARIDRDAASAEKRGIALIPLQPGAPYFEGAGPRRRPHWAYQNQPIYVIVDPTEQDYFFGRQPRDDGQGDRHPDLYLRFRAVKQVSFTVHVIPGAEEATLVLTGHMQHKHMEFVFLHTVVGTYEIDPAMVKRFEDDDQITLWQEQAFPADKPTPGSRARDGLLRDGEPVFFLLNDDQKTVRFFGRAQLFRLPYGFTPAAYVPEDVRGAIKQGTPPPPDIADAIFGYVRPERVRQDQAYAGRISVSDATFVRAKDGVWLSQDPITPHILASPKPTTFQHYLVQTSTNQQQLSSYTSHPDALKTTLRGHKLYWHQNRVGLEKICETNVQKIQEAPKQYTQFLPVNPDVTFRFCIHFENLNQVELGALLWVLQLAEDERYRLKLGMGKPLGMGSVKITPDIVKLSGRVQSDGVLTHERVTRYAQLFDGEGWAVGERDMTAQEAAQWVGAFEKYILDYLEDDPQRRKQYTTIRELARIQCLLTLLRWPGPDTEKTRYMEIDRPSDHPEGHRPGPVRQGKVNEYSNRLVLPMPQQVYPQSQPPEVSEPSGDEATQEGSTIRARVGGVGANDASVMSTYGAPLGRARCAPDLPRKLKSGDLVLVRLNSEGRPEIIVAIL